ATDGHITAGINENAIPIMETGMYREDGEYAIMRYTGISKSEPNIMNRARLPTLSTRSPNSGVAIIAARGSRLFKRPGCSKDVTRAASPASTPPWAARILLVKRSMANVRKGKIAE